MATAEITHLEKLMINKGFRNPLAVELCAPLTEKIRTPPDVAVSLTAHHFASACQTDSYESIRTPINFWFTQSTGIRFARMRLVTVLCRVVESISNELNIRPHKQTNSNGALLALRSPSRTRRLKADSPIHYQPIPLRPYRDAEILRRLRKKPSKVYDALGFSRV